MDRIALTASHRPALPATRRGAPVALVLAALLIAGAYVWAFLVHPLGGYGDRLLSDFGTLPLKAVGLTLALLVIIHERRRRARWAWTLLLTGLVAYIIGSTLHGVLDFSGQSVSPSLADVFYLASYGFVVAGLVLLPSAPNASILRWRLWINVLVAVLSGSMILLHFVLSPVLGQLGSEPLKSIFTLAYPLADLGLLAALATVASRRPFKGDRWAIALFSLAVAGWFVADLMFAMQALAGSAADGTSDLSLVMGDLVLVLAAAAQLAGSRSKDAREPAAMPPLARAGSYLMLALGLATLLVAAFAQPEGYMGLLTAMGVALVLLIVARQIFEEYERRQEEADLRAEQVAAAAALKLQAHHDALTGLPNRLTMHERLGAEIGASRLTGRPVSLIFIDLNLFKEVNDTLGHAAGDQLLVAVAERLTEAVRSADTVARLGGDEFAIVAPGASTAGALALAASAKTALERPFDIGGAHLIIGGAFGVATFPFSGAEGEADLMRQADMAMYHAKREHLGPTAYDSSLDTSGNLSILTELRGAIAGKGLHLLYQPWRQRTSKRLTVVEALVRWDHPTRGRLAPSEFLELAAAAGLSRELDARIVELACAQAAAWRRDGLVITMSVNISPDALQDAAFADQVAAIMARFDLPASAIELEVTEEGMLRHQKQAGLFVEHMRKLGVRMAIDDFGTGFSSLARLRDLRVSSLKIDQQFVRHVLTEPDDAAIVEAVVGLAHRLGLEVVAEGVEDEATLTYLENLGVDFTQGYFLARPLEPAEATSLIAAIGQIADRDASAR